VVLIPNAAAAADFAKVPGRCRAAHNHVNQQVTMLKSGALEFEMGVVALEDSTVTDLFTPAREDWIRGDDAYLRR
jgi:hypothetical protein